MNWRTASSVCADVGLFATLELDARVNPDADAEGVDAPDCEPIVEE